MKLKLLGMMLLAATVSIMSPACVAVGDDGPQVITLEEMADEDYARWQLYVTLGVKIGASRLLEEGMIDQIDLTIAATVLEAIAGDGVLKGTTDSFIIKSLQEAGLRSDELELVLLIVEQELLAKNALGPIDPTTGMSPLSPRTQEMLRLVASSLRSASVVTDEEASTARTMNADFSSVVFGDDA